MQSTVRYFRVLEGALGTLGYFRYIMVLWELWILNGTFGHFRVNWGTGGFFGLLYLKSSCCKKGRKKRWDLSFEAEI